jgi:hypothetical protein
MPGPLSSTKLLPGYPQACGGGLMSILDHIGPASYTQVTPGSPPTGGDVLTAAECGLKFIDAVSGQLSDDATYEAEASMTVNNAGEVTQVRLLWQTAATGAQVAGATNLSARQIRFIVYGR